MWSMIHEIKRVISENILPDDEKERKWKEKREEVRMVAQDRRTKFAEAPPRLGCPGLGWDRSNPANNIAALPIPHPER